MYGADRLKCFMVRTNLHQLIVLFDRENLMNLFCALFLTTLIFKFIYKLPVERNYAFVSIIQNI